MPSFVSSLNRAFSVLCREKRCLGCGLPFLPEKRQSHRPTLYCPACEHALQPRRAGYCPLCGELAAWPGLAPGLCGRCLASPPPWNHFFFHAAYEGLLRRMVLGLKFRNTLAWGHGLGALLAENPALQGFLREGEAPLLVPVPLHLSRLRERGYNQATEIARGLLAFLPEHNNTALLQPGLLSRIKAGPPQRNLSREARAANVRGVFRVEKTVAERRIVLLDDIYTTGATLRSATDALREAGAGEVAVGVVARTPMYAIFRDLG